MSYGLKLINIGSSADSGTGDSARNGSIKINTNFIDIYSQFGDVPVDLDPNSPTYGTRKGVQDLNSISADSPGAFLHPAGYWQKITAKNPGELRPSDSSNANVFPISRGEQLIIDFSQLNAGEAFHVYLPIARKGDVVKIRDAYNTLTGGRKLKIWASPLVYTGGSLSTWEYGQRTGGINRSPDPAHVYINGVSRSHTPYTKSGSTDPNPNIPTTKIEDELVFTNKGVNVELVYGGDFVGWTLYKLDPFDPASDIAGRELFAFPVFNSKYPYSPTGVSYPAADIIFHPASDGKFDLIPPVLPGGSQYWRGGYNGANTIFYDEELILSGVGNSFILKNIPDTGRVGGATYQEEPWDIYLSYPVDSIEEEKSYKSRTLTIVNDSNMPFVVRPMWKNREGLPLPGKDFTTTVNADGTGSNLANYGYIDGAYSPGAINASEIFVQFNSDVSKVKFVYGDLHKYSGSQKKGWLISEIETKTGILNRVREFVITDTANGITGDNLPRYESEMPVTKLDVLTHGLSGGVINIITGNASDPLAVSERSVIEAIDLEIEVNGVTLIQGSSNTGDYYAFKGGPLDIQNTNPLDYANTPIIDRRYTLFNAIHFRDPLLPGDHVRIKWKNLVELDAVQAAAILDLINSQLVSIISSIGSVELFSDSTSPTGFGVLKQGGTDIPYSTVSSKKFILKDTDWDQGEY